MAHDDRYDLADEYMEVVYRLWEESWDDDAVLADRAAGIYADPAKVRRVSHAGRQYRMDAHHLCAPSPQRTPVLYQAGASERGQRFAATPRRMRLPQRRAGGGCGEDHRRHTRPRRPARPRLRRRDAGAGPHGGGGASEAGRVSPPFQREGALAHAAASLGIDFDRYGPDEPIEAGPGNAIQSNVAAMRRATGPAFTRRGLIDQFILGSRQKPMVGSVAQVAERLIAFAEETGADGFNLSRTVFPECLEDVVDLLVPELQARGAYKREYAPGTYREKLFGQPRLAPPHPAALLRTGVAAR
jgi:alkanesulfonate monooxygenase SsuD/methylene tetrahydromethanopterin reductase-like flavin-dependent oxidoreductase (luciferase family)